ncbi:hypothetical protein V8914_19760 [Ralstonia mannitolilytica]|nr:hypothetical protein G5A69_10615 [Ralstonia mannitolilytica]
MIKVSALKIALILFFPAFAIGKPDDASSIGATSIGKSASVKVTIGSVPCSSWEGESKHIDAVNISVGNHDLWVPRSAYSDLCHPNRVAIKFDGKSGAVTLDGGDGSEAYVLKIFFDRNKVTRRVLSSPLVNQPTEETRYMQRVLQDVGSSKR